MAEYKEEAVPMVAEYVEEAVPMVAEYVEEAVPMVAEYWGYHPACGHAYGA